MQFCYCSGTLGIDGVKTVRATRRADRFGQNAVRQCQTFRLSAQIHESPNRSGIQASDTSSQMGLAAQKDKDLSLMQTDPIIFSDQRFRLYCQKPSDQDKDTYFGTNCLVQAEGNKCIAIEQKYEDNPRDLSLSEGYKLNFADCKAGKRTSWNIKNRSVCFTPPNHLIRQSKDEKLPDPPKGC